MENIYLPYLMVVKEIKVETPDIKTLKLVFQDTKEGKAFRYRSGQFCLLSLFGVGEATFCLASTPTRNEGIECSVKRIGKVTEALHDLEVGNIIGMRGPYGNYFPLESMKGKDLLFVAGGIGLAPLRSLINNVLDNRRDYGRITIINGARSPRDLVYKDEYATWERAEGVQFYLTVDKGEYDWDGRVSLVPTVLMEIAPSAENTIALTCGPPIMIKYTIMNLIELGFSPEQIITTLEMKMKCGLGKCGRCNVGRVYVCKDGPVFSYRQLKELPQEY